MVGEHDIFLRRYSSTELFARPLWRPLWRLYLKIDKTPINQYVTHFSISVFWPIHIFIVMGVFNGYKLRWMVIVPLVGTVHGIE